MRIDEKKLNLLLCDKCMSIADLASTVGVARGAIYATLNRNQQRPKTIGNIAKALGVRAADLIEDDDA